jgi:hypothetical protein
MPLLSCGQTTFGIKGGLNWGSVRNSRGLSNYEGTYTGYQSYCFGFDVKHRLKNLLGLGGSVEYYMNNTQWHIKYGGHNMSDRIDIRYKIGYLRLTIFPEVIKGKRFQFYFNAGPFLSFRVYSNRDGIIWDHGHPHKTICYEKQTNITFRFVYFFPDFFFRADPDWIEGRIQF